MQGARGQFKDLFQPSVKRTTLQLWLVWFGTACLYYGIVLAQSDLLEFNKHCGAGERDILASCCLSGNLLRCNTSTLPSN